MSARRLGAALRWALAVVMLCWSGSSSAEQDPNLARGFSPGELYDYSGIDSINLFNLGLNVNLPLGPRYPVGDGLSYGLSLSHSSNTWEPEEAHTPQGGPAVRMHPRRSANAGHGWMVSLGGMLYRRPADVSPFSAGLEWESSDGSEHLFYIDLHVQEGETDPCFFTRDNTYLRLCVAPGRALPSEVLERYTLEFPDGTVHTYEEIPTFERISAWDHERFQLVRIEDRLDNWVAVSYVQNGTALSWEISDSVGRFHTVDFVQQMVDGAPRWRVTEAHLAEFGGGSATYELGYVSKTIYRSCKTTQGLPPSPTFTVSLLSEVVLPWKVTRGDGGMYRMPTYNLQCSYPTPPAEPNRPDLPGTLARLELPTGGVLEWDYIDHYFVLADTDDPVLKVVEKSTGVFVKRALNASGTCDSGPLSACAWTYTSGNYSRDTRKTTVVSPSNDRTEHFFRQTRPSNDLPIYVGWDYGLPYSDELVHPATGLFLSTRIYDGSGQNQVLMRESYLEYERDRLIANRQSGLSQDWANSNRRMQVERTLYHDDKAFGVPRFTETRYEDFDGVGHYRQRHRTGNFVDPNQTPVHTEITSFNSGANGTVGTHTYAIDPTTNLPGAAHDFEPWSPSSRWILGLFASKWLDDPSSPAFEAQFCFSSATGRLLRQRMLVSSTSGPNHRDVVVAHTRNRVSASDIRYQELTYGGDGQDVDDVESVPLCDLDLPPAPVYRVRHTHRHGTRARTERLGPGGALLGLDPLNLAIDSNTGLPSSSTELGGLVTTFEVDALGRLVWLKPQSGGDAWTEIVYQTASGATPAQVTVRRRPNGNPNGAVLEEMRTVYDPFGRVQRDERRIPGHGWTSVVSGYNAQGWKTLVTERGPGTPTERTVYREHDPFGRPTEVRLPDYPADSRHYIELDYNGVRRVGREVSIASNLAGGETRSTTSELSDHLGRLWRVQEPSGPSGAMRNTDYEYDAAGRLTKGRMKDADGFQQTRSFVYDGRGFLLSEQHPENGTTTYSDHDALGHARRKTTGAPQGPFDLAFTYDAAERLLDIEEFKNNGTGRALKSFTYGTGTSVSDRSNGKIKTALRHNWVYHPDNGNLLDVTVQETYTYGGTGGRVSARESRLSPGQVFNQARTWDSLGNPSTIVYPTCAHVADCTTNPHSRTLSHQYSLGYLTAIPGWASSILYHSNGMLEEIVHSNGVRYGQGRDIHRMRRPGSLWVIHATQPLTLALGDPNPPGTPLPYAYDGAGNVKSWYDWRYRYDDISRILEGSVVDGESQKYTYDMYGNLKTIVTDRGVGPQTVSLGVDRSTNRLSASSYDAAGNLTVRAPFVYTYDSFSMMTTAFGAGNDNTYIYTADDERIWEVDSSVSPWRETYTLRDLGGKALRVFTTDSGALDLAWSHDYIHRNGQLLATARANGAGESQHHFHLDHLGTPLLITTPQGGTEALHSYFPFGEEFHPDNDSERMKFTGHERDLGRPGQADDLDYMHARYCSPLLGRFLSRDPASVSASRSGPQSWNRYTYAQNNPIRFVDTDGRIPRAVSVAWNRFKHFVRRHVRKDEFVDKSKFKTNDPRRAQKIVEKTIMNPDVEDLQRDGRIVSQREFSAPVGLEGETIVTAITQDEGGGKRKFITAFVDFDLKDVVSLVPWVGGLQVAEELGLAAAEAAAETVQETATSHEAYENTMRRYEAHNYLIENY